MKFFNELNWNFKKSKILQIKLLVFDVDGVLTDGGLWYNSKGEVEKKFDVKDGLGIKMLQKHGFKIAFISGGVSGATEKRAEQLEIDFCFTDIANKSEAICKIQKNLGLNHSKTLFVGDDLNDIVVKPFVNLLIAPQNANNFFKKKADLILNKKGGNGAVRELSERVLKSFKLIDNSDLLWKDKND